MPRSRHVIGAVMVMAGALACSDSGPPAPVAFALSPDSVHIPQGSGRLVVLHEQNGRVIPADLVRFSSSDTTIATVDESGWVTASGHAGTVKIIAALGSDTASAGVEVIPVLAGLIVNPESIVVRAGDTTRVGAWALDLAGDPISVPVWFRSVEADIGTAVGSWNTDWALIARGPGSTTLTATIAFGWPSLKRSISVRVTPDAAVRAHVAFPAVLWGLALGPDGAPIVSLPDSEKIVRLDPEDYSISAELAVSGEPRALAVDTTTATLFVGLYTDSAVAVVDLGRLTEVSRIAVSGPVEAILFDEARASLHVLTRAGWLYRIPTATGAVADSVDLGMVLPLALDAVGGQVLAVSPASYAITALQAGDYSSQRAFFVGDQGRDLTASHDGQNYVSVHPFDVNVVYVASSTRVSRKVGWYNCAVAINATDTELYVTTPGGELYVLTFPGLGVVDRVHLGGSPCTLVPDSRNGRLVTLSRSPGWVDIVEPSR